MIVIQPHTENVNVVCFAPDGALLASVSEDGWVKVWNPADLHTGKPVWAADADLGDEDEFEHSDFDDDSGVFDDLFSGGLTHAGMALSDLARARGNLPDAEKFLVQGNAPLIGDLPPGSNEVIVHGIFGDAKARAAGLASIETTLPQNPGRWPESPPRLCCAWIPAGPWPSPRMPRPTTTRCC